MVKHDRYPECTSSVLQALILFKELHYGYHTQEIEKCIRDAATFIESRQGEDGSWFVRRPHFLTYLIENFTSTSTIHNVIITFAGQALGVCVSPMGPSFRLKHQLLLEEPMIIVTPSGKHAPFCYQNNKAPVDGVKAIFLVIMR